MDATQQIEDPFSEEEDQEEEEKEKGLEREPLATLKVFKNDHIPETEFPLYVGENVLGRDPAACSVLLPAQSVSGRHAVISISVFRSSSSHSGNGDVVEALLWDMGSLNGTRKGRFKLTPQVRYALTERESVVIADVPCEYVGLNISKRDTHETPEKGVLKKEKKESSPLSSNDSESKFREGVRNGLNENERSALPPVPLWNHEDKEPKMCSSQPAHKHPEITLVPESDSGSDEEDATDERKDFVSDSASSSHLCSSTNSSFLTPAKKVIPESEDESSITPSSASGDRFRLRETSGEPCSNSSKPGLLALNLDSDTDFEETDMEKSKTDPEVQPELAAKVKPVPSAEFDMDSDTDVEEEELETSKAEPEAPNAVTLDKSVSSVGLHMDSDTDFEEEEEEEKSKTEPKAQIDKAPKVEPVSSADFHMDSDTDVEEEVPEENKAKPEAQNALNLDKSASSVGLHMDSDTDVEEEEEKSKTEPKAHIEEAPKEKTVPLADLHVDSDTDVEENDAPITEKVCKKKAEVLAATESALSKPPHTEFNMDSDTDVEDDNIIKVSHPIGELIPTPTPGTELHMVTDTDVDEENEDKEKVKARDLLSNSETDDEDPFKPVPGKAVKVAASQKASVGGKAKQSEKSTHKKQDHHQVKNCLEEPTQDFGHLEDWDLQPTQAYGAAGASAGFKPKQLDLEATQAYGTDTDREEDQEELLSHTQLYSNLSTAETQLIPVAKANNDDDVEEDEETPNDSHLSTADTIIIASTPTREEQTQPFSLFTAQTQLIWEGEGKEFYQSEPTQLMEADTISGTQEGEEDNVQQGRRIHGGEKVHKGKNSSSSFIIAETQPMCEEEEATDADLSGNCFLKPSTRQQAEKCNSAHLDENNSSSHFTIAETQPMGDDEEAPDQDNVVSSTPTEKHARPHITIAETQPMFEEEQADDLNEVSKRQPNKDKPLQQTEKATTSNLPIFEKQDDGEDNEGQEKELSYKMPSRKSFRGRPKKVKEASQPAENVVHHTIIETQLMCEEEQACNEDLKNEINTGVTSTGQQTDQLRSPELAETGLKSCVTIAETQPICEEEAPCEDLTNTVSSSQIDEHSSTEIPKPSNSHFIIAETQPMHEEDEGQEKNLSSKISSRRSRRGKPKIDEVPQTSEGSVNHTITEAQPVPEEVIERDEDMSIGFKSRRSRRGRLIKEDCVPQPTEAAVSSLSTTRETQPVCEDGTGRDENLSIIRSKRSCRRKQEDEGEPAQSVGPNSDLMIVEAQPMCEENTQEEPSCRSSRRQRKDKTEVESETPASGKVQGKTRKGQEGKRKRGKALSEDEGESEEEKNTRKGTRRAGLKQKCSEKEKEDRLEESAQAEKERMEKELQEQEERERAEREENERLEREQKKQEEKERAETEMRRQLEREQQELEEKERLKREEEEKTRKEHERIQREKDRLEREEKERLERERREQEEKRQKEEERIQMEMEKTRKEHERIQREKDCLEREEKERLERESREREEQRQKEEERIKMEKEQKENERLVAERERLEKEVLQMRAREQKETEDRNHQEAKHNEGLEEDKTELETPLVLPARRSRRCSSSSMNSEQSVSSLKEPSNQRGRGRGRGRARGRGRQSTNEQPISARQSSRRGQAIEVEDIEQDPNSANRSRSRSSSRSSERSAISVVTSNQGTRGRGRGRKSVKLPETQDVSQAKTSGKGRGRGGRHSVEENVNVGMSNERKQDAEMTKDTAVPQTNSRGRKRAANTSTSTEEAPSPTPKTPRRSVSSQAHKVLFTGLSDEDGERVVSRLGGSLAKGVNDMTHLVTDKARRTVKFLCAVAKGVPIVTPDWLKKCGKAGQFLSCDEYILKDVEQEKKFSFNLQKTLQTAQRQPLLKGYEIHVTSSVMPEPSQMKEIITCCGARFLPKMPSAHKEHTVVVSCEQDRALCQKAASMSLPVVSTEFLLTGILQQRVDLQAYSLISSLDTSNQPAAPKAAARGRRK